MISNIGKNNTRIEAFDMTHDQNPLIPRDSLRVFNRKEHYGTSPSDSYPKYCIVHLDFLTKSHEKFDFTFSFLIKITSMFEGYLTRSAPLYWTPPGVSQNYLRERQRLLPRMSRGFECNTSTVRDAEMFRSNRCRAQVVERQALNSEKRKKLNDENMAKENLQRGKPAARKTCQGVQP